MTISRANKNKEIVKVQAELEKYSGAKNNFAIKQRVIEGLENIQDLIIIILGLGLFGVMFVKIEELFMSLVPPLNFQGITPDILFVLILVEIFRLLVIYLQEKEISVAVAVEISIVSILRELIVRGVMEMPNSHIWSIGGILLVLGVIMIIPSVQIIFSNSMSSYFRRILSSSNSGLLSHNKNSMNYMSRQNITPFSKQ